MEVVWKTLRKLEDEKNYDCGNEVIVGKDGSARKEDLLLIFLGRCRVASNPSRFHPFRLIVNETSKSGLYDDFILIFRIQMASYVHGNYFLFEIGTRRQNVVINQWL
ncbi:hypothetical protein JTE90_003693 [Oedothorax gibbosus]|uniref:Uncharacterized protein n=1 Tax=Oedothorax gibbosus TaxID=931172 RepID=A0AAV6VS00_9ARAC|nr:hypothetical protein JTE90_003693 [Oedothorax gibbosus]